MPLTPTEAGAQPPHKYRKRELPLSSPASSDEDFLSTTMSADEATDDEGYTKVISRRARRMARNAASPKSSSTVRSSTVGTTFTVVFVPKDPTHSLYSINKLKLSRFLEVLAPGHIKEARVNPRKNVIAVDANSSTAVEILLATTSLCGADVRAYLPRDKNTVIGVIRDVDADIPEGEILQMISSTAAVVQLRRFGTSNTVKLVFRGDSLPATVKVGLVRHAVRPYVPRPLQCRKCMKLGHVIGACSYEPICSRCGGKHAPDACTSTYSKCANCSGDHDATSTHCPLLRREMKICQRMARDHSSHKEAASHVRNAARRSRRHTPSLSRSRSKPPVVASQAPAKNSSATVVSSRDVQWPTLQPPRSTGIRSRSARGSQRHDSQRHPAPGTNEPSSQTIPHDCDKQVISLLRTLVAIIRSLIISMPGPTGTTAAQILNGLIPVLECLDTCPTMTFHHTAK